MARGITNASGSTMPNCFVPAEWDKDGYITDGRWYGTAIPDGAFGGAFTSTSEFSKLKNLEHSGVMSIGGHAFHCCGSLRILDFPAVINIGQGAFYESINLDTLILRNKQLCIIADTYAFHKTKIASGTGFVYVPSALVSSYKSATNWVTYANQIRAIEDYPEITGG